MNEWMDEPTNEYSKNDSNSALLLPLTSPEEHEESSHCVNFEVPEIIIIHMYIALTKGPGLFKAIFFYYLICLSSWPYEGSPFPPWGGEDSEELYVG